MRREEGDRTSETERMSERTGVGYLQDSWIVDSVASREQMPSSEERCNTVSLLYAPQTWMPMEKAPGSGATLPFFMFRALRVFRRCVRAWNRSRVEQTKNSSGFYQFEAMVSVCVRRDSNELVFSS